MAFFLRKHTRNWRRACTSPLNWFDTCPLPVLLARAMLAPTAEGRTLGGQDDSNDWEVNGPWGSWKQGWGGDLPSKNFLILFFNFSLNSGIQSNCVIWPFGQNFHIKCAIEQERQPLPASKRDLGFTGTKNCSLAIP